MRFLLTLLTLGLLALVNVAAQDKPTRNAPGFPGPTDAGAVLPNGWRVTPAGHQTLLSDLPLNIWTSPDGKYALVATNGYNAHELTVIDLAAKKKVAAESAPQSWFGLATDEAKSGTGILPVSLPRNQGQDGPATSRLWWSGGGDATVRSFVFADGKLEPRGNYPPTAKASESKDPVDPSLTGFRTAFVLTQTPAGCFHSPFWPRGATNHWPGAMHRWKSAVAAPSRGLSSARSRRTGRPAQRRPMISRPSAASGLTMWSKDRRACCM